MAEFREILTAIKKRNFAQVYILMGAEAYYIDKIVQALEHSVVAEEDKEFDQTILYGADNNIGAVIESAARFPLMSERQLVILKEAQTLQQAKTTLDKLKGYVEKPNPNTVLAIAFKGDVLNKTSGLMKAAARNKDVVVFDSPKIKDFKVVGVVKDYCVSEKISIEDKAIELLTANVGTSLSSLFSEIEKLQVALPAGENRITADLVSEHIGVSKEFNNFELVSALARRNYFQCINIIKYFEENPKTNPTVLTCVQIFNFYQKLVLATFSSDKSERGLMEALQLKTPYALKDIHAGLANYNASQAVKAIHAIRDFDTKSKGVGSFQKEYSLLLELIFTLLTL